MIRIPILSENPTLRWALEEEGSASSIPAGWAALVKLPFLAGTEAFSSTFSPSCSASATVEGSTAAGFSEGSAAPAIESMGSGVPVALVDAPELSPLSRAVVALPASN